MPCCPSTEVLTSIPFAVMVEAQMHQPDGVVLHKRHVEMRTLLQWVSIVNGFVIGVGSRTLVQLRVVLQDDPYTNPYSVQEAEETCRNKGVIAMAQRCQWFCYQK